MKWTLLNEQGPFPMRDEAVIKNQSPKQRIDGTAALLDCYVGLYEHYTEYTGPYDETERQKD